jgi:hypothetical protein
VNSMCITRGRVRYTIGPWLRTVTYEYIREHRFVGASAYAGPILLSLPQMPARASCLSLLPIKDRCSGLVQLEELCTREPEQLPCEARNPSEIYGRRPAGREGMSLRTMHSAAMTLLGIRKQTCVCRVGESRRGHYIDNHRPAFTGQRSPPRPPRPPLAQDARRPSSPVRQPCFP